MKERPILFSAPMVRAILAGTKTQTRRVVKPVGKDEGFVLQDYGDGFWPYRSEDGESGFYRDRDGYDMEERIKCPYGKTGDRLWVREAFAIVPRTAYRCSEGVQQTLRPDDDHDAAIYREGWVRSKGGFRWRPSIHMPRWASRITLEITGVRVERLQDISEADCWAEGVEQVMHDFTKESQIDMAYRLGLCIDDAKPLYAQLWESINGPGSWEANPWVWVVEFKGVAQ